MPARTFSGPADLAEIIAHHLTAVERPSVPFETLLDLVGTLLWVGPIVGLGYAIGRPAVDVVNRIDHYSVFLAIALVIVLVVLRARRAAVRRGR